MTDPSFTLADVTFVAARTAMPRLRKDLSSSADTASSSFGTMRGKSSISVTSLPNRRKIDANSTPTAPLPMIAIDFGTAGRWIASSLVMMCFLSISMPGTLRGADPVATTISRARSVCASAPVTSTVPLPASRAVPFTHVILFFLNRNSTPFVMPVTILSLRACTRVMSIVGVTSPLPKLIPHVADSWAILNACACSRSALVGMQPQFRHVPPSAV